ncbi:BglG family transcription antiterminator [Clostridium intestinale]|uniref:Lichenan operon transcriptional antiterminator n=1 Tax=Clostridium intestinale DSM 6191 TaxID=1121320 RepID=A0A1M5WCV8_9CLOT|nr:PTS sugar transporter subunit IIA [Clostridium intestinale]SHH85277.1 lichenan operon transcriptional antiterminator [Clostridium intestinale DSM 6191]
MRIYHIMKDFQESIEFLSVDYFTKKYKVSKRTIQNDIAYLIHISSKKGFKFQQKRGIGYLLEILDENKLDDFMKSIDYDEALEVKDRINSILAYLSMEIGFTTMDKIAEVFEVSKSLVKKDIKEVEKLAEDYALKLVKKSHYGIYIDGSIKQKKNIIIKFIFDENKLVIDELGKIIEDETYRKIENKLITELKNSNLNINYNELRHITAWLMITIYINIKLKTSIITLKEDDDVYFKICSSFINKISEIYKVGFKHEEALEFMELIKSNVRIREFEKPVSTNNLEKDIDDFLEKIDKEYHKDFKSDENFKQMLLTHVSLLIQRLNRKKSYKNSLIDEICIKYPMTFNIAIKFCEMLSENYHVETTRDEMGFLATYFAFHMEKETNSKMNRFSRIAVVCSSGGGSAYIIKLKLETLFDNAEIKAFSFLDIEEIEKFMPDLIFTIKDLDLELNFKAPVIYIKELLDDMDILRIKQVLSFDQYDRFSLEENKDLYYTSLYKKDYFEVIEGFIEYRKILEDMSQKIENSGYGGENYSQYVMQREDYLSTIYLNGVALPHPIQMCAKKNLISVAILKEPCIYEGKEVRIIFMISLTKDGYELLKDVTKKLYEIMNKDELVDELCTAKSYEQFMAVLNTWR